MGDIMFFSLWKFVICIKPVIQVISMVNEETVKRLVENQMNNEEQRDPHNLVITAKRAQRNGLWDDTMRPLRPLYLVKKSHRKELSPCNHMQLKGLAVLMRTGLTDSRALGKFIKLIKRCFQGIVGWEKLIRWY